MDEREESQDRIPARATINLPGLRHGDEALVDPATPYISECLEAQYLVPLEQT